MITTEKKQQLQTYFIPFDEIPQLSSRDKAYANSDKALRPFYKYEVNIESFAQVIEDKKQKPVNRSVLVEVLKEQYEDLATTKMVEQNIAALEGKNTFTLITAHQPSLFTGPLYYIYKIISTINLAKKLNVHYPNYYFVPVFITGGEDHDFEEVQYAYLFNKKLLWESGERGSVGKMRTASILPVLEDLNNILGNSPNAQYLYQLMKKAHTSHELYADATIDLVNELFKKEGLVVVNMSHPQLKRLFIPIIKEELLQQPSQALVETSIQELEKAGFGGQATPRSINFFYLREQIRARFILENGIYKVLNTDYTFTKEELLKELEKHPERFSPNVVMRPLFQEYIMPNLAYIGGGGELAYWMERQSQFAHFGVNFPMLIRRNSVVWIDKGNSKKMDKLGLSLRDIFEDVEVLIKRYVQANTDNELSLKEQKIALRKIYDEVIDKAKAIDSTLVKTVKAEQSKQFNSLNVLEAKLLRAEKQRYDIAINQIRSLIGKLFPSNGLQERHDNFMSLYLKYGEVFFDTLKENLDVLDRRMVVIMENE